MAQSVHQDHWDYTSTITMISGLMDQKMFPLTIGVFPKQSVSSQKKLNVRA